MKKIFLSLFFASIALNGFGQAYLGGECYSNQQESYGRFEVRMKAAEGSALVSAFFLWKDGSEMPAVFWEEVDVEILGKDTESFQSNVITGLGATTNHEEHHPQSVSLADDFHTYSVEWTPDYLAWFIDGQEVRREEGSLVSDVGSDKGYRFNLWASSSVAWAGAFDPAILPRHHFVNWIKYYEYTPGVGDGFTLDWEDQFDTFNSSRWNKANWTFGGNLVTFSPLNVEVMGGMLILSITTASAPGFSGTVPVDSNTTAIDPLIKNSDFHLYPNPAESQLTIESESFSGGSVEIEIYASNGHLIQHEKRVQQNTLSFSHTLKIGKLPAGLYFLRIRQNGRLIQAQKFIKSR